MTLHDLWCVCPHSHIFINNVDGVPVEYTGSGKYAYWYVVDVRATRYPNYNSVLSVTIKKNVKPKRAHRRPSAGTAPPALMMAGQKGILWI